MSEEPSGSSRQDRESHGVRVPCRQLLVRTASTSDACEGDDACSARMTTPRLPGDRCLTAVGATWVACELGGLNISEWLQSRNNSAALKSLSGALRDADLSLGGEGRCRGGSNGHVHPADRRDRGPGIQGQAHGDNVGKGHRPAGAATTCEDPPTKGDQRRRGCARPLQLNGLGR